MQYLVDVAYAYGRLDRKAADGGVPIYRNPFEQAPRDVRMAWLAGFNAR